MTWYGWLKHDDWEVAAAKWFIRRHRHRTGFIEERCDLSRTRIEFKANEGVAYEEGENPPPYISVTATFYTKPGQVIEGRDSLTLETAWFLSPPTLPELLRDILAVDHDGKDYDECPRCGYLSVSTDFAPIVSHSLCERCGWNEEDDDD